MLLKTHLAIAVFFILVFIETVESKLIFVVVTLAATYLPDVDSRFSTLGRKKIARVLQWFTRHRGMIHSFSLLLIITFFLVFFIPVIAFGFFLGYGLHLLADSFTKNGIRPFYPWKKVSRGHIRTGGRFEIGVLVSFVVGDLALLAFRASIF